MAYLTNGNTEFATLVSLTGLHRKSSRLKQLITSLQDFQRHRTETKLDSLYKRLYLWIENNPKEYKKRKGALAASTLLLEIRDLAVAQGWALKGHNGQKSDKLINSISATLQPWKQYACSDVGAFSGDINTALSPAAKNAIYDRGTTQGRRTGIPNIPRGGAARGDWNAANLSSSHAQVTSKRAGECTSFGFSAAHLLSTVAWNEPNLRPRIEVVSFKIHTNKPRFNRDGTPLLKADGKQAYLKSMVSHVYCIVGRRNLDVQADGRLPHPSTWGDNVMIVDPWLGSLGYESVYNKNEYPKPVYLTQVYIEMDSYQNGPLV